MADGNFEKALAFTLKFEGGYVNNPKDPGGATNLGVTIGTLSQVLGRAATIADVKKLTAKSVAPIYKQFYWDKVMGDDLPLGLDLAVFDFGVHSGPPRAVMALQQVVGVADDGKMGPITLAAAQALDPTIAVQRLCAARLAFLSKLNVFKAFGPGLRSRVAKCEDASLSMIATGAGKVVDHAA